MSRPRAVVIRECFARDGLQNEDQLAPTDLKVRFVDAATEAGFPKIVKTDPSNTDPLGAAVARSGRERACLFSTTSRTAS